MRKKWIVSLIIVAVFLLIILDIKHNFIRNFERLYRELETESLRNLIEGDHEGFYHDPSAELEITDQLIYIGDEIKELYIDNGRGSIEIRGEEREDILLSYKLTVYAASAELAESFIKELSIVENTTGERLSLKLERKEFPSGVYGVVVDYDLSVPERLFLDIRNSYGKLGVENIAGDIAVKNEYGHSQITDIGGRAVINSQYGKLTVRNIESNLQVVTRYNTLVDIAHIRGNLNLDIKYSRTKLADIGGNLDLKADADSVDIDGVKGSLEINAKYTNLTGSGVEGKIRGTISYGQFDLYQLENDIDLKASYIDIGIHLKDSFDGYLVYCEVENGDIRSNLPYKAERENRRQILSGGDGEKIINIVSKYGDIRLYK